MSARWPPHTRRCTTKRLQARASGPREAMMISDRTQTARRRVLFIAYTFPPVGGAGVQRTTKFVKYLPQFGWNASVLTASNPSVPRRARVDDDRAGAHVRTVLFDEGGPRERWRQQSAVRQARPPPRRRRT